MKGFIDENGKDRPACVTCAHKNELTVSVWCYGCIPLVDLALHKPNHETDFANYKNIEEVNE